MSSIDSGIQLWALDPYTGRIAWHKVVYTDPLTTPNVTNLGINRRACEILSSSRGVLTHFVEIIGDAKEIKPGGKGTRAPESRVVRGDTGYGLLNRLDESAGRFLRGSMSYAGFEADQIVAREDRLITLKEGALQQLELNENGYLLTEAGATAKKGKAFKTDWRIGVGMGNSKVKTYASSMAAGNRVAIGGNPWLQPTGVVEIHDTDTGKLVQKINLSAPVAHHGLAIAGGRLYATLTNGTVVCLAGDAQ